MAEKLGKPALVDRVVSKFGVSQAAANEAVNQVLDALSDVIERGDSLTLVGFGSFSVKDRAARNGRNPATGESIKIAATKAISFKPSSTLRDRAVAYKPKKGRR